MIGVLLGDRLVWKLRFPEADIKDTQPLDVCKARCDALQSLLCVGDKSSIVNEKKVHHLPLLGLGGLGCQALWIEEAVTQTVPYIHPSSSSKSSVACLSVMVESVCATTQRYITSLVMGKGSERSSSSLL